MASKMSAAIDANNKKVTISLAENSNFAKPLKCEFCDAQVRFVNGFTRQVGEKIVPVSSYFGLSANFHHGPDCRYNVHGQVKIIVRQSEGNILIPTDSGEFELRLLAVKKTIQELQEIDRKNRENGSGAKADSKNKEYIQSGRRLGSYINSAIRVLRVRALCEDSKDIESHLKLVFDGVRVSWRDFYYEDSDYFRCFSNLANAAVQIPLAIKGNVKYNKIIQGKNRPFAIVDLAGPYRKTEDQCVLDAANVSIWSTDLEAFNSYKVDDEILAFGIWDAKDIYVRPNKSPKSSIREYRNHDIRLWLVNKNQLCKC